MYGIYANIWGMLMVNGTPYMAYMDPMGMEGFTSKKICDPMGTETRDLMRYHESAPMYL